MRRTMKTRGLHYALVAAALLPARTAHAEGVSKAGKGIVGFGLLGAEVVVFGEAIAGLDQAWLYYAGAGLGAVGGATGGYFLESSMTPKSSVLVLTAGMALAIPALIVGMDATRRHWREVEQPPAPQESPSNPPDPDAGPELVWDRLPTPASALVRWSPAGLHLAVPDVYLTETYTAWERWAFALPRNTNYTVAILSADF